MNQRLPVVHREAQVPPLDPQQVTVIALLLAIGAAGLKKAWVFGWTYAEALANSAKALDEMTTDRDFWRDTALKALGHTDKALDVAAKRSDA